MKIVLSKFLPVVVLCCLLFPVASVNGQVSSVFVRNYPQSYTVKEGDTIRQIAGKFLADPSSWDDFWQPTPFLQDDRDIRAGDVVRVEFINGRARLVAQRGDLQVQRLEPQMRVIGVTSEIPAIALEDIQSSFTSNRIVDQATYEQSPHIVSPQGNRLVIGTGDEIYARGTWPAQVSSFEIYRQVNSFVDPQNQNRNSLELLTVGTATVVGEEAGDIKRLRIIRSKEAIRVGDRLLIGEEQRFNSVIYPRAPARQVSGRILAMTNTERMASQLDTVLLDVGDRDGLNTGDVLTVKQIGDQIVDDTDREKKPFLQRMFAVASNETVEMPGQEVGTVLVYRVFDHLSYGLILTSSEPARQGDQVVNP
ncbi:MAG: LysM domain-containing protein [Gammaproteobacteria bacterium]|nr:LysM peptidoglycan-binding domain-containing protein [Pseudomonadales bacterium]MCP5347773.1 LysM peptidoglycan-binding domain-containing protein [Pseudomonadales bacterium]